MMRVMKALDADGNVLKSVRYPRGKEKRKSVKRYMRRAMERVHDCYSIRSDWVQIA